MTRAVRRGPWPGSRAGRAFALVALVDSAGTGLYLAGSTIFFVRVVGMSAGTVGLGLAASGAAGLLCAVPLGTLADRWGARRVLVVLQTWRAVWFVALAFVHGAAAFVAVSVCLGAVERAVSPASQSVVAAAVPGEDRTRTLAFMRSVRNVGFSLGAVATTPLLATHSTAGYRAIILADAGSFIVAAFLLSRLRIDTAPAPVRRGALAFIGDFRDWHYLGLAGLNGVLYVHTTVLTVALPLWTARATAAPVEAVPLFVALNTVLAVVGQVPFTKNVDSPDGPVRALTFAGLALIGCSAAMAAAAHAGRSGALVLLVVATVLLTAGELWQSAGSWEVSYRYAPDDRRTEYLAVFGLGAAVQEILGPPLIAVVVVGWGTPGWLALAAGLGAVLPLTPRAVRALERTRPAVLIGGEA
ncbi:MFS family permease [Catenulispora sp. GP43]|uniref:MFS transporter n=1 Tax=Catenulispora sp. GP43 TaxID=3156263 RepID=UPI003512E40F